MKAPPNAESTVRPDELSGGHTPGYWAAKARPCPKCGAEPDKPCRTVSGNTQSGLHGARYVTAQTPPSRLDDARRLARETLTTAKASTDNKDYPYLLGTLEAALGYLLDTLDAQDGQS